MTWEMVGRMETEAHVQKRRDVGVVSAVEYAAALRMGKATSVSEKAFYASEDVAERHLT